MTTKKCISKNIASELGIPLKNSNDIVNSFIKVIKRKSSTKIVKLSGFGSFYYYQTPKRVGRNPKTKESYIIKPIKKLNFRASNKLRKTLN
jgi:integration host factor subunit alpha